MDDPSRKAFAHTALAWLGLVALALTGCVLPWRDSTWRGGPGMWGVLSEAGTAILLLTLFWVATAALLIRYWATFPHARPLDPAGARRAWGVVTAVLTPTFIAWAVPLVAFWQRTRTTGWWFFPPTFWTPQRWVSEIASQVHSRSQEGPRDGFWLVLTSLMLAVLLAAVLLPSRLRAACAARSDAPAPQPTSDPARVARWHIWLCLLGVLGPCLTWFTVEWPRMSLDPVWEFVPAGGRLASLGFRFGAIGMLAVCVAAVCTLLHCSRGGESRFVHSTLRLITFASLTMWAAFPILTIVGDVLRDMPLQGRPPSFYVAWLLHLVACFSSVFIVISDAILRWLNAHDRPADLAESGSFEDPSHGAFAQVARLQIALVLLGLGSMLLPWERFQGGWFTGPGERIESATGFQLLMRTEWDEPDHGLPILLTGMFLVVLKAAWVLARTRWPVVPRVSAMELLALWGYSLVLDLFAAWLWIGPHAFNTDGILTEHGNGRLVHVGAGLLLLLVTLALQPLLLYRAVLARGRKEEAAGLPGARGAGSATGADDPRMNTN